MRPERRRRRKKSKQVEAVGVAHILATFNNTIITLTDTQGNVISWSSAVSANSPCKPSLPAIPGLRTGAGTPSSPSRACGYHFRVSVDNLDPVRGDIPDSSAFCRLVLEQARTWRQRGLPQRAQRFYDALCREFGTSTASCEQQFTLEELI